MGLERLRVHRAPPRLRRRPSPARISAFASAIASRVPSSSRCTGPTFVIAATSGSAISQSSAIWPRPRIAISSTSASVSGGAERIVERQADLGVVVLRARVDPQRQDRASDVLDRRLPRRAGDPDDRAAQLAPPSARQPLQRPQRVVAVEHPAVDPAGPRPLLRADHATPQAPPSSAPAAKCAAVDVLARQPEEQVARPRRARVDRRPLRGARGTLARDRRPRPRRRSARGRARSRRGPQGPELLAGDIAVVERDLAPALELLSLLVALARRSRPCRRPRRLASARGDRRAAVDLHLDLGARAGAVRSRRGSPR